jgi:hypothetical protein
MLVSDVFYNVIPVFLLWGCFFGYMFWCGYVASAGVVLCLVVLLGMEQTLNKAKSLMYRAVTQRRAVSKREDQNLEPR